MRVIDAVGLGLALLLSACAPQVSPPPASPSAPSDTPLPNGMTSVTAASGPVLPGTTQPFSLYTHCGLDNAVIDFGGTLWDPVGYPGRFPNPPRTLGDPSDQGTIALTAGGTAVFVSESGTRIDLVAHPGPKDVRVCY